MSNPNLNDEVFDRSVTLRDAYRIMVRFLEELNEIGTVDTEWILYAYAGYMDNGESTDPAALEDFVEAALFGAFIGRRIDELYRPTAEFGRLTPDDRLLDVECGRGAFLHRYARDVGHVAGIDRSGIHLEMAHRRLGARVRAGTAELVEGDASALPWEDNHFSVITCVLGLQVFTDPNAALAEMWRVLHPGGRLVAAFWINKDNEESGPAYGWFGLNHLTEGEVREMVEDAGFDALEVTHPTGINYHARFIQAIKPEQPPQPELHPAAP